MPAPWPHGYRSRLCAIFTPSQAPFSNSLVYMRSTLAATALATLRDSLLLEGASRRIEGRSPEQQRRIRELFDGASVRAAIASELVDARQHGAAFALLKEATALYVHAIAVAHHPERNLPPVDSTADSLSQGLATLPHPPPELAKVRPWLEDGDPLAFDRLPHDEALERRAQLDRFIEDLRHRIEPRTERELSLVRKLRLGALGFIIASALSFLGWKALAPTNIARGKPVMASSRHPQSTAPPDGLTDGSTGGAYGVHTRDEDGAWVMVDLQSSYRVGRIKVFNRGDGYFDEGLPFALELSENGVDFTEVERRTTSFSRLRPWAFDANGQQARYVRVRKIGRGYVALGELEVYGAR